MLEVTLGAMEDAREEGSERHRRAIALIDEANAQDPNLLTYRGESRPKELWHAEMMTGWVRRLRPNASEELLLAARAHHIRRWEVPRSSYPEGRKGYLRWRAGLHEHHARLAAEILKKAGYQEPQIERVRQLIRKQNLRRDPDVQLIEDCLCLVFLDTQLADMRVKHGEEKTLDILSKTLEKMSPLAQKTAAELDLEPADAALLKLAVEAQ